jgi:transposase
MRPGAEYFLTPAGASQRRYEALRAYFVDDMPAAEVADRFGYSTASVHQMATLLRGRKMSLFTDPRPGPKGPRKATGELRARVLALRAAGHSVTEISAALTAEGLPVSAQTAWQILDAEGIGRLPRRDEGRRGPPARLDPVQAARLPGWPAAETALGCDHAGLLLLFPAMADLGPARPGPRGGLSLHPGAVGVAVGRHAAFGQVRPQGPRPPCRLTHR